MKKYSLQISALMIITCLIAFECAASGKDDSTQTFVGKGAYYNGSYHNLFAELLGQKESQVQARIDSAFQQLFYGDEATQRVYYPRGDMAYVEDIANNDVRTEGMSYGMMIAVQLNKKPEFDRLWKWAKTYMQHRVEPRKTYFAWHCRTDGTVIDSTAASDGEEWFVTALFFASARWGNGGGIFNYRAEAQSILDAMLNKEEKPWSSKKIVNMFNLREKQVVFVPDSGASWFTDPSYHLPHYYELWGRWATNNTRFWCEAATVSRAFLEKAAHPKTGLMPDYARFDGTPLEQHGGGHAEYRFDAWRTGMNVAIDHVWFAEDPWEVIQSNRLLSFFREQGIQTHGNQFTLDGTKLADDHSAGLVAANAVAAIASTSEYRREFIEEFWNTPIPSGHYRYYDGMLYMLGLLQVSGQFRIYDPTGGPPVACPGEIK